MLLEMQKAFRQKDKQKLATLLPSARGHVLEPWAAYWELKARLEDAPQSEVDAFLQRYAGSYQEDRLRNDWLLLLGQRRDWERFMDMHAKFRMRDDKEVQCYALNVDQMVGKGTEEGADLVLRKMLGDGGTLLSARAVEAQAEYWRPWRAYAVMHLWRNSV